MKPPRYFYFCKACPCWIKNCTTTRSKPVVWKTLGKPNYVLMHACYIAPVSSINLLEDNGTSQLSRSQYMMRIFTSQSPVLCTKIYAVAWATDSVCDVTVLFWDSGCHSTGDTNLPSVGTIPPGDHFLPHALLVVCPFSPT